MQPNTYTEYEIDYGLHNDMESVTERFPDEKICNIQAVFDDQKNNGKLPTLSQTNCFAYMECSAHLPTLGLDLIFIHS